MTDEQRKKRINEIMEYTEEQREKRFDEIEKKLYSKDVTMEELDKINEEIALFREARKLKEKEIKQRKSLVEGIANGTTPVQVIKRFGGNDMEYNNAVEDNKDLEIRAFQKYISTGIKNMTDQEQRALNIAGSAAVLPVEIINKLITGEKYSDLLYRATVINQGGAGKLYIPVASNTAAAWKIENSDIDGDSTTYEKEPTLTKIELGGYELYRWMRMSAATYNMATPEFTNMMLGLLSAEVVETLEAAFINGTGTGQPKGLDELVFTAANSVTTTNASTPIAAKDIAEALSFLPQKYARGAILLVNADMLYKISQYLGTAEFAFDLSAGAKTFLGHEIVVSEHMADDTAYWVDPKELYIRFAQGIQVESSTQSGFTAAAIDLRALCVVDAAWNPSAVTKVSLGTGS